MLEGTDNDVDIGDQTDSPNLYHFDKKIKQILYDYRG